MPRVIRKAKYRGPAPGRVIVTSQGFGAFCGAGLVSHRVRDRGSALQLLRNGMIDQENYDTVAPLLPGGRQP